MSEKDRKVLEERNRWMRKGGMSRLRCKMWQNRKGGEMEEWSREEISIRMLEVMGSVEKGLTGMRVEEWGRADEWLLDTQI